MSLIMSLMLLQAAATPSQPASAEPAPKPPAKAKLICKTIVPTGSRLGGERTCAPKSEWDRLAAETQEGTQDLIKSKRTCNGGPC